MTTVALLTIAFGVPLLVVTGIHARVVRFAVQHRIVDHPDFRKLQRVPVPVLGGVAVFCGQAAGLLVAACCEPLPTMGLVFAAMLILLLTGLRDDCGGLSPAFRFAVEGAVVLALIHFGGYCIDNLHGLAGIGALPRWAAVLLTLVAVVGIINAMNLIDGVNGLSSGFCIMACTIFGIFFYRVGNRPMLVLAAASTGALIPFFCHNVFGKRSRMYIGDSGTLVLGLVLALFVCETLRYDSLRLPDERFAMIPFTLSVMSVPVFDTLRVMTTRCLRGTSPFRPDRIHLHHRLLGIGCSHPTTTLLVLLLDLGVLAGWWLTARMGAPVVVQCAAVVGLGLAATLGVYHFFGYHLQRDTRLMRRLRRIGRRTHLSRRRLFLVMQYYIDKI